MRTVDKAYLAGIVDGEGYIGIIKSKDNYFLTFAVDMADTQALELLAEVTGRRIETDIRKNLSYKIQHRVRLGGVDAQNFLREILPYLRVKKNLAELAIEYPIGNKGALPPETKNLQAILFGLFKTMNKRGR